MWNSSVLTDNGAGLPVVASCLSIVRQLTAKSMTGLKDEDCESLRANAQAWLSQVMLIFQLVLPGTSLSQIQMMLIFQVLLVTGPGFAHPAFAFCYTVVD